MGCWARYQHWWPASVTLFLLHHMPTTEIVLKGCSTCIGGKGAMDLLHWCDSAFTDPELRPDLSLVKKTAKEGMGRGLSVGKQTWGGKEEGMKDEEQHLAEEGVVDQERRVEGMDEEQHGRQNWKASLLERILWKYGRRKKRACRKMDSRSSGGGEGYWVLVRARRKWWKCHTWATWTFRWTANTVNTATAWTHITQTRTERKTGSSCREGDF